MFSLFLLPIIIIYLRRFYGVGGKILKCLDPRHLGLRLSSHSFMEFYSQEVAWLLFRDRRVHTTAGLISEVESGTFSLPPRRFVAEWYELFVLFSSGLRGLLPLRRTSALISLEGLTGY